MQFRVFFFAVALVAVKPVFAVQTNTPENSYKQGVALERAGEYSQAIEAFEAATTANPGFAWAYRDMGTCYYRLGDIDKARQAYAQYLTLNPRDTQTKAFAKSLKHKQALDPDACVFRRT
jgi:Flp pilus assembly protein TadD